MKLITSINAQSTVVIELSSMDELNDVKEELVARGGIEGTDFVVDEPNLTMTINDTHAGAVLTLMQVDDEGAPQ